MQNTKIIAFAQTLFYGAMFAIIPMFISALGQGGALDGLLSPVVTGIIITILNYFENQIQTQTGSAMFGTIKTGTYAY